MTKALEQGGKMGNGLMGLQTGVENTKYGIPAAALPVEGGVRSQKRLVEVDVQP